MKKTKAVILSLLFLLVLGFAITATKIQGEETEREQSKQERKWE